jgi:hypothetical protein
MPFQYFARSDLFASRGMKKQHPKLVSLLTLLRLSKPAFFAYSFRSCAAQSLALVLL